MSTLQRLTTEYVDREDRIRLSGESEAGDTVVLWLTQRLLNRLLTPLCDWLLDQGGPAARERTPSKLDHHAGLRQSFAQQAARAGLTPQPPVRPAEGLPGTLVVTVNLNAQPGLMQLDFLGATDPAGVTPQLAGLALPTQNLRQWLNILFDQYRRADWPLDAWPAWMQDTTPAITTPTPQLWH